MNSFTHLDQQGHANMVDITTKAVTQRKAIARGFIRMQTSTLSNIREQQLIKGDVIATAHIAAIQGAKRCADLIPLCHPLMLSRVSVEFELDDTNSRIWIYATCKVHGNTGVEMEALTAVSVAALTLFDMCKAVDKTLQIGGIQVQAKYGGKNGDWEREDA
ncbi:cyclic pyranopterin monophosphate synthase MoaC [Neptunicella sp.]|uniref:cyclic pyranopterin monophosphate synthase MoaC n=1 Tax=Neptunicella sp. TaxID=2125986 RepID=UPI003F690AD4